MPANPPNYAHAAKLPLALTADPGAPSLMTAELRVIGSPRERVSVGFWDNPSVYTADENSAALRVLRDELTKAQATGEKLWVTVELEGPMSTCPRNIVSASKVAEPPSIDEEFMALVAELFPKAF